MLISIVRIKSNLEDLYDYNNLDIYKQFSIRLGFYEEALSKVIIVEDPYYMKLTIEKRHLIRELHTLLIDIDTAFEF